MWSSNLVARLVTWPAMYENCSRSKSQKSRSQGHNVTHKKFTQSRALALVTLESKRPLIVIRRMRCDRVRITHSHGSESVVRTTSKVNGKCWNFYLQLPLNPLSDRYQIWRAWLRHGYLSPRKTGLNQLRGFFSPYTRNNTPPMFATLPYTHVYYFLVLPIAYSRDACMDFNA